VRFPNGTTLEADLWCETRDGVCLATDVYRPAQGDDRPVLLLRTPYGKAAAQANELNNYAHPTWFAAHGYIVVVQDVRGRYRSEGDFDPVSTEYADGYDAVEWCASLPGSNGRVGMYGMSYGALTQFAAAALAPPSLLCLSPAFMSPRVRDLWQVESLPRTAFVVSWTADAARDQAVRAGAHADADALAALSEDPSVMFGRMPLLDSPQLALIEKHLPFVRELLTRPADDDGYWQPVEVRIPSVPALYLAGWYDTWLSEVFDAYEDHVAQGDSDARLLVGPWAHVPWRQPLTACGCFRGEEPRPDLNHLLLEWFDWQLKGTPPSSWLRDSPAQWFDYGSKRWQTGRFGSRAREETFHLLSDGLAVPTGSGVLSPDGSAADPSVQDVIVEDPLVPTPSVGGWSCCYDRVAPMGPADQAPLEAWGQVAVYTSDPLTAADRLEGAGVLTLGLTTETVPTTVMATLCVVRDGVSVNVARGLWRTPRAGGLPWRHRRARIRLSPAAFSFQEGDRLRLLVHGSSFPEFAVDPHVWDPPAAVTRADTRVARIVIRPAESALALPFVGRAGD
jgi:uncharacterized protein